MVTFTGVFHKPVSPVRIGGGVTDRYEWTVVGEADRPWTHAGALVGHDDMAARYAKWLRDNGQTEEIFQYSMVSGPVWLDIRLREKATAA